MELQQVRYFLALSQELHFQRAAGRSNVSQPTLSQQIKKLEEELGVRLFERSSRRVRLTPAGERFLPHALSAWDSLQSAASQLKEQSGRVAGRLRVGAIPSLGPYLLPDLLIRLRKEAPLLSLEVHEETTANVVRHLKEGSLDLGLLSLPIDDPATAGVPLAREPFDLAVSKKHPLASRGRVKPSDLKGQRLLVLQEGHCFGEQVLEYCKLARQDPQVTFQGSSLSSVMKLTAAGEGVTLVPRLAADPQSNPGLRFVPFAAPGPSRELGVLRRSSAPLTRSQELFVETVRSTLARKLRGGR